MTIVLWCLITWLVIVVVSVATLAYWYKVAPDEDFPGQYG